MCRRSASMLLVACAVILAAGLPAAAQGGHGLEVVSSESRYVPEWSSRRAVLREPGASDLSARPAGFELSAVFRNTGTKAVASVSWEFVFFRDAQQTQVMLRQKFRDGKTIAPGEEARLEHTSPRGAATEHKAVRITRVVYADGTVWQAAKTKE